MSKIQDIILGMSEENTHAATIHEELSRHSLDQSQIRMVYESMRKGYGKKLREMIGRKTRKIAFKHSQSWGTHVDVFPLHNHITHTTTPLVEVKWDGRHGEIKLKCWAITPEKVEKFLERFEAVVIATQLHEDKV